MEAIFKNHIETLTPDFPVVGIGAAAGGLDALKKLLESLSEDSGMAYIIIQHQTADHPGRLTEMLARHSKIPVHEIIHTITLVPNHIYVIPENTTIVAIDGMLQLRQRIRSDKTNSPVDLFFESLAKVYKSFTIGVLLSGTTFDGTMGFKRIKESGGATMVQDPETAAFMRMPQSAIDADAADFVLSPENIPAQLLKISNSYNTNHGYTEEDHIPKSEEEIVFQIINLIFLKSGHDFRHYKQPTLRRRIARRMVIVGKDTLEDYYNLVRNDKAEQDFLFNDFLIPVTYFFRDQSFFDSLPAFVLPLLFQNSSNTTLRVWVAGCSTGEEAYSIAICIHEYILKTNSDLKVQIFASDVSEISITKARAAAYFTQDVQHISEERLNKYFVKHDGRYQISKIIRDMCIFATHNFTKNPPFARIDLISCRNVLLYFNPFLQNKVLGSFHYSLKEKGLLFLGKSETAASAPDLFEAVEKTDRVYIRKFAPNRYTQEAYDPLGKESARVKAELLSSSEELESPNKAIETSTQELQSANEELRCVNDELLDRQDQLISMRNYSESIVQTISEPLLIMDKNFIIKSANPAFYKYFNTSENKTEGQGFFEMENFQWDRTDFKAQVERLDWQVPVKDFIAAVTCSETGQKTMIVNARRMTNTKPEGMILLALKDITDLEAANELVRVKNTELQRHNEQLELFTSGASDDLQEPLRKIHMFSKRFYENEKNLSETGKHNLERILFLSANMSQLITDLINYSKITFIEKEFKSTDLNLLLRKTVTDLKDSITEKHAVISLDVLPLLSVIPHQIQQLFTNLIANSIKYAQEGVVPELKIESRQPSEEELIEIGANDETKYVKICVSDNGIGFGKEYENRIFAPFYRLHNKDASTGSGLGLTLVKKIVENHHGFIQAKSTLNEGTQMHLYLPV